MGVLRRIDAPLVAFFAKAPNLIWYCWHFTASPLTSDGNKRRSPANWRVVESLQSFDDKNMMTVERRLGAEERERLTTNHSSPFDWPRKPLGKRYVYAVTGAAISVSWMTSLFA